VVSQENVEIARSGFEAQPNYALVHPAVIYDARSDEPDPSSHVGRDAFERLLDVHQYRDGLVVEGWEYRTEQEAHKAVGLEK
jgi:hypothetical protein